MKKRHEVLFNQLEAYRTLTLKTVEDISEEQAELIPNGFNNNIRWNLGHIYLDQYLWIQDVTKENANLPAVFQNSFGFCTSPSDFTWETPSTQDLKILLKNQPSEIKKLYGERLEEEFEPTDMGMYTIEQVLIRTIFHEGIHYQAILDMKKFL
ncbi:DinB family protein [Robertmurraya sp. DFI.2.37]|uniref:DinB family protein n=1 Tax=Robertmurraya sp. DFI.2.37 TaxID=3031819 RepID=UPI001246BDDD|nr:DinB family protein [Robertmurraya sp. DFI.2.37]MDF1508557.1 DinB family protein [Robertmurraya sp. DFI.2.37]